MPLPKLEVELLHGCAFALRLFIIVQLFRLQFWSQQARRLAMGLQVFRVKTGTDQVRTSKDMDWIEPGQGWECTRICTLCVCACTRMCLYMVFLCIYGLCTHIHIVLYNLIQFRKMSQSSQFYSWFGFNCININILFYFLQMILKLKCGYVAAYESKTDLKNVRILRDSVLCQNLYLQNK